MKHLLFVLDSLDKEVFWKLEASPDDIPETNNWIYIFNETTPRKYDKNDPIIVISKDFNLYSSFRFTVEYNSKTDRNEHIFSLIKFDIFGNLVDINDHSSLDSLIQLSTTNKHPFTRDHSYRFPCSDIYHDGLLHFFSSFFKLLYFKIF